MPVAGLWWLRVGWGAAYRPMGLCPSPRDSTFLGQRRVAATDIRPRRAVLPVVLSLRLALWRRRLSLSRRVLELRVDTCGGSERTKERANCDEC
jgi:hypothetical protein